MQDFGVFIVVRGQKMGKYHPSRAPFVHFSRHKAEQEASRLAKKYPCEGFSVFKQVTLVVQTISPVPPVSILKMD